MNAVSVPRVTAGTASSRASRPDHGMTRARNALRSSACRSRAWSRPWCRASSAAASRCASTSRRSSPADGGRTR
ncbi:hypothetical protein MF672_037090 [Actinomadura sp. ATCC 31491]|uniref:Uncharacterized protein n=1 Tax=Actinomadura luzonensis TaxID=2805427 RepID=A0ABT0G5K4_9ACTN|nr:hypothetical protein [Actinomadura luzonensis]MCK2219373.1 hypothetical protein [Actinomadura luzonensis]